MNIEWLRPTLRDGKTWLYIAASALLILMAIAAFASPAGAWPLSVAAIVCIFLANIDRFSQISASTTGVSATIREANAKIEDLKNLIEIMSEAQIYSLQSAGRWGGDRDEKDYYFQRILFIMRDAGVSEQRIRDIREKNWDYYVKFDYVHAILGGSVVPHPLDRGNGEIHKEWMELRKFDNIPSPARIREFLDKIGEDDPKKLGLLNSYESYCRDFEHSDPELWKQRGTVTHLIVKNRLDV